ncbi:hypothetical protein NL676_008407 [Syzygium grande]|nr:hypothetical protein NL676_008407 [Syzygium grande]
MDIRRIGREECGAPGECATVGENTSQRKRQKPWWTHGAKNDPFNSGTLYIKRKVGACSYVDDPIGCFSMTNLRASSGNTAGNYISVDQLVSTFSSVPSLIAFARLCRDPSWNSRPDVDFQEFCLQVLFECVSKDRPALLQVYLSLYTTMELMADLVMNNNDVSCDSVSVSSLKLALAYTQAALGGKLTNARGSVVQSIFIGALRKRLEDLFQCSRHLSDDLHSYLKLGRWPADGSDGKRRSIILSWYLQWFGMPSPSVVEKAVKKVNAKSGFTCLSCSRAVVFPLTIPLNYQESNLHVVSTEAVEVAERVGVQKQGINTVRVFVEWDGFTIEEEGIDDGRSTRTWGLLKAVKSEVELGRIRRVGRWRRKGGHQKASTPNARTTGGTAGIARKRKSAVEREDRDNQKTTGRD